MPFEGVAQRDALKTPKLMQFATLKLRICANQVNCFLHPELPLLKNRNNTTDDFKNLKSVGIS
jgi:hypothetical protein